MSNAVGGYVVQRTTSRSSVTVAIGTDSGPFSGARDRTRARLKRVGELRNDVFHFRREITIQDHQELSETRAWILMRSERRRRATRGGTASE